MRAPGSMVDSLGTATVTEHEATDQPRDAFLPRPTLPAGGGAIRGMGETFSAATGRGTATLDVPLPLSAGRGATAPALSLSYDSGGGSSVFGLGFSVATPCIGRRTSTGVPEYTDEDTFQLNGVGDLVPWLIADGAGGWRPRTEPATVAGRACLLRRYRPRTESAFARIERCEPTDGGTPFWRTVSRANVTTLYGVGPAARVAGPGWDAGPERVAQWLVEEVRDDLGNVTVYEYKAEDTAGVDPTALFEQSRLTGPTPSGRYLKRIRYVNTTPGSAADTRLLVVFDYGEHDDSPAEVRPWAVRPDPFSSHRAGFEVRTWRLCQRVLMFHDFGDALGPGPLPRLVRAAELTYEPDAVATKLVGVRQTGYRWVDGAYTSKSLPPLEFGYTTAAPDTEVRVVSATPVPRANGVHWADLDGDGLPGVLSRTAEAWWYQRNAGGGALEVPRPVEAIPVTGADSVQLADVEGDGALSVIHYGPSWSGFRERVAGGWAPFVPFAGTPMIDLADPNLRRVDLDGDGRDDLVIGAADGLWWYRGLGRDGYGPGRWAPLPADEERGPRLAYSDRHRAVLFADMSGDGLADLVRIGNGEVCYWPGLGRGRFGAKVVMAGAPVLDAPGVFDPARIRLGDTDGSGPLDLIYLGRDAVRVWPNLAGNGFGPAHEMTPLPTVDALATVDVVDLLGTGTRCLVWVSALPADAGAPVRYLDLSRGTATGLAPDDPRLAGWKPHLLNRVTNNMGAATTVEYAPSTRFHLADRAAGRPWVTRLPFPVQVVAGVTVVDEVCGARLNRRYAYRDGHFDGVDREFRGFGMVESIDAESVAPSTLDLAPARTRSWFHLGVSVDTVGGRYRGDPLAVDLPPDLVTGVETGTEYRDALAALAGTPLRVEVYADDGRSTHPISVVSHRYQVRRLQPQRPGIRGAFHGHDLETLTYHYERDPVDPRIGHHLVLEVDEYGGTRSSVSVGYPRRLPLVAEQARTLIAWQREEAAHLDTAAAYRVGVLAASRAYEVTGLPVAAGGVYPYATIAAALPGLTEVSYEDTPVPGVPSCRLVDHVQVRYWDDTLSGPLPVGQAGTRGLVYRNERLAFTPGLLTDVFGARVSDPLLTGEGGYVVLDGAWWAPSDVRGYDPAGFYLPSSTTTRYGNVSSVSRDPHHLFVIEARASATAPFDLLISRATPDYRVLDVREVTDPNGNRSTVEFDELGLVIASWSMGRAGEGDTEDLPGAVLSYDLDSWRSGNGPVWAHTEARERHADPASPWQRTRTYTDGLGRVAMTKTQAEPGQAWTVDVGGSPVLVDTATAVRWVGTGRTVYNNKGLPVEQYEPYFSASLSYEDADELVKQGVTAVRDYDPLGRLIRLNRPDGTFTRQEFGPWHQLVFDANDTVLDSRWYTERQGVGTPSAQARAAMLAAAHAGTPNQVVLDSLGRPVRTRADNGPAGVYESRVEMDIEGNTVALIDARGLTVHTVVTDLMGRALRMENVDAGTLVSLPDHGGNPIRSWTATGHTLEYGYDLLRRPDRVWVRDPGGLERVLVELTRYGEEHPQGALRNLLGRVHRHYDQSGLTVAEHLDLDGNVLFGSRRLAAGVARVNWSPLAGATLSTLDGLAAGQLDGERFQTSSSFDALGRVTRQLLPDGTVITTRYNEAGLPETFAAQLGGTGATTAFVAGADYDAHRRRIGVTLGNGVRRDFEYEPDTLRLARSLTRRGAASLQDLTYTYDPVGNVVEIADGAQQAVFFDGTVAEPGARFSYDALYRLRGATGREHTSLTGQPDRTEPAHGGLPHPNDTQALRPYTQTFDYDEVGNLRSVAHAAGPAGSWTRTYQYAPDSHRLLAHSVPAGPDPTFDYDAAGNMIRMPHLPNGLRWDHGNRLAGVSFGGGEASAYRYDAAGNRSVKVRQHAGGLVEETRYLGAYEVYRRRRNGVLVFERRTVHLELDGERVALVETVTVDTDHPGFATTPTVRYQLANHLGSSTVECDGEGRVISYEEYHPYGTTALRLARGAATVSTKRYRYLGKEKDEETGLYQLGARYYASWLCRFVSCDPAGLIDGPNLYRYCRDNPVRLSDPGGTNPPETKESLEVTLPLIKQMEQKGIKWAREVPYEVTVNGQVIKGRFDLVYEDPALAAAGKEALVAFEAKRDATSPFTEGQAIAKSSLETGANIKITGPAQGGGNLTVTRGQTFNTGGGKWVLVHKGNFGQVTSQQLGHLPDRQQYYEFRTVDAQGRTQVKYFDSPEELIEFNRTRTNVQAGVLSGQSAAKPAPTGAATGASAPGATATSGAAAAGEGTGAGVKPPTPPTRSGGGGPPEANFGPGKLGNLGQYMPALQQATEGIQDYLKAKTPEEKRMAILKMLSAILLLPAVQNRIDAMLASGTAAMGSALITGANRFSSGLFVLIDGVIPDEYLPSKRNKTFAY